MATTQWLERPHRSLRRVEARRLPLLAALRVQCVLQHRACSPHEQRTCLPRTTLSLVNLGDVPDFLDCAIGEADPAFLDSKEVQTNSGRASSCEDLDEDDSNDDHCFTVDAPSLEALL